MRLLPRSRTSLLLLLCTPTLAMYAKSKHTEADRQDDIEVVAHLPLPGSELVTHLVETRHCRQEYLYAEHESHEHVTLINITSPEHPAMMGEIQLPSDTPEHLRSVVGNAALIEAPSSASQPSGANPGPVGQTYRVMSFLDPAHPTVKQEFTGVTAIGSDDKRGLIFLANKDGLWVLHEKFAMSPEDEALQRSIEHSIYDTP